MKRFLPALVFASISMTAMGNVIDQITFNNTSGAVIGTTFAPIASLAALENCGHGGETEGYICVFGTSTYGPISTSTLLALVLLKEEVQQVEQDAYNLLAGEGLSDALKTLIEKVKEENAELQGRSDKDIAGLLIDTLSIK